MQAIITNNDIVSAKQIIIETIGFHRRSKATDRMLHGRNGDNKNDRNLEDMKKSFRVNQKSPESCRTIFLTGTIFPHRYT